MSRGMLWARRTAAAAAAMLLLGGLSRVPYDATGADHAAIRLSWRSTGELVQECRRPTPAELERLPIHMRREEICEGRLLPYRLRVMIDGRLVVDDLVKPSGMRGDRPLYVFREIPVKPGSYRVAVSWEEEREERSPDGAARVAGEVTAGAGSASREARNLLPRQLGLETGVELESRDIALITYDINSRALVLRAAQGGR
jgi:hypothetical protein